MADSLQVPARSRRMVGELHMHKHMHARLTACCCGHHAPASAAPSQIPVSDSMIIIRQHDRPRPLGVDSVR